MNGSLSYFYLGVSWVDWSFWQTGRSIRHWSPLYCCIACSWPCFLVRFHRSCWEYERFHRRLPLECIRTCSATYADIRPASVSTTRALTAFESSDREALQSLRYSRSQARHRILWFSSSSFDWVCACFACGWLDLLCQPAHEPSLQTMTALFRSKICCSWSRVAWIAWGFSLYCAPFFESCEGMSSSLEAPIFWD